MSKIKIKDLKKLGRKPKDVKEATSTANLDYTLATNIGNPPLPDDPKKLFGKNSNYSVYEPELPINKSMDSKINDKRIELANRFNDLVGKINEFMFAYPELKWGDQLDMFKMYVLRAVTNLSTIHDKELGKYESLLGKLEKEFGKFSKNAKESKINFNLDKLPKLERLDVSSVAWKNIREEIRKRDGIYKTLLKIESAGNDEVIKAAVSCFTRVVIEHSKDSMTDILPVWREVSLAINNLICGRELNETRMFLKKLFLVE